MGLTKSPTQLVVGGLIGLALLVVAWNILPWQYFLIAAGALLYEAWTLINQFPNDTISEILWEFSDRPMVPWIFGVATGWALATGFLSDPYLVCAVGFLQGHFWFQRHEG